MKLKAIETHRGINTNPNPKNEDNPVTTINRFKQKTISLPRIDDTKRLAGYAGITGISRRLARLIPWCDTYVEPFAGVVKVYQELLKLFDNNGYPNQFILNDKSKFVTTWLKKEFKAKDTKITSTDFAHCIKKYDSKDTVFVIDQPWNKSLYYQGYSHFDRKHVSDYDKEILELCHSIKGKFFITTRKENTRMKKSGFKNILIESEYPISGRTPRVLVTTNISKEDYN